MEQKIRDRKYLIISVAIAAVIMAVSVVIGFQFYRAEIRKRTAEIALREADSALKHGDFSRAIEKYQEYMAKTGQGEPEAYKKLAIAYLGEGDRDRARESFEKAAELDKNDPEPRYQLAVIYYEQGNREKAIDLAREAASLKADYIAPRMFLGKAYLNDGEYRRALDYFLEVLRINPSPGSSAVDIYKKIALCYEKLGDTAQAVFYYQKAWQLAPEDFEIQEALRRLTNE